VTSLGKGAALLLGAILGSAGAVALARSQAAPAPTPTPAPPAAAPSGEALPACADCHTDLVAAFASNPHARWKHKEKKPGPEDACSNCHGDGTAHVEAGGDTTLIQTFRGAEGSELCLSCHTPSGEHDSFTTGFHANSAAVNCLSCHSVHGAVKTEKSLLAQTPGQLCQTCHQSLSASFRNKPYVHRLDRGGMTCLDCHEPHSRKGESVKLTREGELACLNCHSELRGPFVFDHVTGSAGDCMTCHQPHGSNNPKMLLWANVAQLCLSCHSKTGGPPTAGAQPPSFHDLTLPRYRNCTSCHVTVHGSNLSPEFLK
jgi:DmsE family decaheme c-type cytochrome